MRNKRVIIALLFFVLLLSMTVGKMTYSLPDRPPRKPFGFKIDPEEWERLRALLPYYFMVKTVFSTISSIILVILLFVYVGIYRKTGSNFSLGLVILSTSLLFYTITSNPLIHNTLGFGRIGFGPMFMIPDLFSLIASIVLLYLSRQ